MQLIKQEKKLPITEVHLSNKDCENMREFKRHGDLLPQHVRLICVGSSNCGKTTALLSLIYNREGLWFENIYIFSKTKVSGLRISTYLARLYISQNIKNLRVY